MITGKPDADDAALSHRIFAKYHHNSTFMHIIKINATYKNIYKLDALNKTNTAIRKKLTMMKYETTFI